MRDVVVSDDGALAVGVADGRFILEITDFHTGKNTRRASLSIRLDEVDDVLHRLYETVNNPNK